MSDAGDGIIRGDAKYDIEERNGTWAVVTADGEVVSEHDLKVNAMSERQRLLESEDPQEGAYSDNVG
ncbi:MAG: hypothetical protein KY457_07165, partial [Actinobacteria bacterium]|nr:hypothetical protein [Actinomycetota bacterium]